MGLQAAEKLVTELAAGRVGTDFRPTEGQKELNIPTYLVYLFGIVIAEDEYQRWRNHKPITMEQETSHHFSPIMEKRFIVFQKQYFASAQIASVDGVEQRVQTTPPLEPKPYKLTTRMLPSKDQQAVVKRTLLLECEKLESLSNEALEALLMEESSLSQQALTKSKRKNKKKKNRHQPITSKRNDTRLIENREDEKKTCTKEVVGAALQHPCVERSDKKNSCVETKNKRDTEVEKESSLSGSVRNEVNAISSNFPKSQVFLKSAFDDSKKTDEGCDLIKNIVCDSSSSDIVDNSNERKILPSANNASRIKNVGDSLLYNLTSPPSLTPNVLSSLSTSGDYINLRHPATDASVLTQMITDLENDLAEANRRSREERLAHTTALRREKERHENLVQALQLRLYISENKVRTYEDALEKHIESISVINDSGCSIKKSNYEERMPSSPLLISKVLKNARVARNGEV